MKKKVSDRPPLVLAPEPDATRAASELMEAMPAIMQFVRAELQSHPEPSLSVSQFRVLAFLSRNPDASLSDVAEHSAITRATASSLVDRLVQRGLIDRQDDPAERRHIMLKLTLAGHDLLAEMRGSIRQTLAERLSELTPEEVQQVATGLALLGRVFKTAID